MTDPNPKAVSQVLDKDMADLEKKKKSLEDLSAQSQQVSKQVSDLGDEIKTLEARIAEVTKASAAYAPVASAQQKGLDDNRNLIEQKRTMASAGVKDQKGDIDKTVQAVDADINSSKTKVDASRDALDKVNRDYDSALADSQQKQAALAKLKQAQKDTELQLKEVNDLIAQAAKAEAVADVASMYFLLEDAAAKIETITVMPVEEYTKKVSTAQADVDSSKTALGKKKSSVEQKNKELSSAQSELDGKKAARQTAILSKLKEMKPTIPSSGPAKEPKAPPTALVASTAGAAAPVT